jgi:hypothetical protein
MTKIEKTILAFLFYVLALGVIVSYINEELFRSKFAVEDGAIEWMTFGNLLIGFFFCLYRIKKLKNIKPKWFLICTGILAFLFFFGAGEEVSWFQRQLGVTPGEFWVKNNSQGETNLHNLVVGGKKINKLIFGTGLGIFLSIYLLIFPLLFQTKKSFKKFINDFAIPLPQPHHVAAYLALFLISGLFASGKKGELLEFGGTCIFLLILFFPLNKDTYK